MPHADVILQQQRQLPRTTSQFPKIVLQAPCFPPSLTDEDHTLDDPIVVALQCRDRSSIIEDRRFSLVLRTEQGGADAMVALGIS